MFIHNKRLQYTVREELGGMQAALPVPGSFPLDVEDSRYAFAFMGYSSDPDTMSGEGRWAQGPSPDGKGTFSYLAEPTALGEAPHLPSAPMNLWNNLPDQGADGAGMMGGTKGAATKQTFMATSGGKGTAQGAGTEEEPSLLGKIGRALTGDESEK